MLDQLLEKRFSPYSFSNKEIPKEDLIKLFVSAGKAPSSYNEQPWRFVLGSGRNSPVFNKIYETLMDANKQWAKQASALVLCLASKEFSKNGKPNLHAEYDLGQSVAYLTLKATEMDIFVHQMAGFSKEKACQLFKISEKFTPVSVLAIGYKNDDETKPEKGRKKLNEIVSEDNLTV